MNNDILLVKCGACGEMAHEPYIECVECVAILCTSCFATGQEVQNHKNSHSYAVRRNDFPLFDNCNWSAKEECKLLAALSSYGFGNWEEIAKSVHTRSKLECQEHYRKYYIENVQYNELKLLPETPQSLFPKPIVPYLFNLEPTLNPPRNNNDKQLAGYNAHRSEFELSYDNNAESIFNIEDSYSDDEEDDCMVSLKVSLVMALNTRLSERKRRYRVLQNHGLVMPNKLISWLKKFEGMFMMHKPERLLPFMQFMTGMQFDAFMESLSLEEELMQRLVSLSEYRKKGIKTLHTARLYKHLKRERESMLKEQKFATALMMKKFDSQSVIMSEHFPNDSEMRKVDRRKKMPLDISDLPGYYLLSDSEKTLCSHLRLLPKNYMSIKDVLVTENNKMGFLRLLDARRLLKIDVNKTRKIYDHLISEGFIQKCPLLGKCFEKLY